MLIYVVTDYDSIEYVGTNRKEAANFVRGGGVIQVWEKGKRMYSKDLKYNSYTQKWENEKAS